MIPFWAALLIFMFIFISYFLGYYMRGKEW